MKKCLWVVSIAVVTIFVFGCSSKIVRYNSLGQKEIITKSNEAAYYELQMKLSEERQKREPRPIVKIPQQDGTVITIYSQLPEPTITAVQHQNQYINPVMNTLSKIGVYGITGYAATEIAKSIKADNTTVSGKGNSVVVDKSESINTEVTTIKDQSSLASDSNKDYSDNSSVTDDNSIIDDHSDNSSVEDNSYREMEKEIEE